MTGGPELTEVEQPFLDHFAGLGRETLAGSTDDPSHGEEDRSASGDVGAAPVRTRSVCDGGRP